ncbi:zinc-binding oxidoreductase-like protein CipB [Macrophomina phaseolina]|uniref:Zinc-binding oxidoreductase-like protein CipB n=1 Tax=Macrophomina phaseolina TaxID=35725 RepID=A0ABQ8GAG3_9PEZI|nr:zinc-binding oxidoreductase-like protein CipB [Macrophomina phaseolina]
MSLNKASWITEAKAKPLKVDEAEMWKPGPGEIVIKNAAIAINPVDWKIQDSGLLPVSYPNILGEDIAGTVAAVGPGVTRFRPGQRAMAYTHGIATKRPANGGFQLYSVVPDALAAPIPDSLSFAHASVLPLALSTAAAGLFEASNLGLPLPPADGSVAAEKRGTLLVWGAASAVGMAAVQLARAAGCRVVATASERNHAVVRSLGADAVLDYRAASVVRDVVDAVKGGDGEFVGVFDAISSAASIELLGEVLEAFGETKVVMVLFPPESLPRCYKAVHAFSFSIVSPPNEHVADGIWRKWVPEALAKGTLQAKPDPLVVGSGLESVQGAMERQKAGVSAQKIVVTL